MLYVSICLHIDRISPESAKKLIRGNRTKTRKARIEGGLAFHLTFNAVHFHCVGDFF